MSMDTYGHYTGSFSVIPAMERGTTTPGVELCESNVPHIGRGMLPAPWLPITRFDTWANSGVVISVGVAVGFDANGFLIPAGILGETTTVTYSTYDYNMKVINVNTGSPVAANEVGTPYTVPSSLVPVLGAIPVGVASYNIYQHLGGVTWNNSTKVYSVDNDNPYSFRLNNTTKEDYVAFTCDYVIEVPWVGVTEPTGLSTTAKSYAHAYGTFELGGPVKVDSKGMFIPGSARTDRLWLGQVLGYKAYVVNGTAIDALGKVKTAYENAPYVAWKMPGSATKGIPRSIHLATDGAYAASATADAWKYTSVIINVQL